MLTEQFLRQNGISPDDARRISLMLRYEYSIWESGKSDYND